MRPAGKILEKHAVPEPPQLREIFALEIGKQRKGKELTARRAMILRSHSRHRHESIVKLPHRILSGAHETFEVTLRVTRWSGAGHGFLSLKNTAIITPKPPAPDDPMNLKHRCVVDQASFRISSSTLKAPIIPIPGP